MKYIYNPKFLTILITPTTILLSAKFDKDQQQLSHNPLHIAVIDYDFNSWKLANSVVDSTLSLTLRLLLQTLSTVCYLFATLTVLQAIHQRESQNGENVTVNDYALCQLNVRYVIHARDICACDCLYSQPMIPAND